MTDPEIIRLPALIDFFDQDRLFAFEGQKWLWGFYRYEIDRRNSGGTRWRSVSFELIPLIGQPNPHYQEGE